MPHSFERAFKAYDLSIYAGLGFVFTTETGLVAIDLDHVLHNPISSADGCTFKECDNEIFAEIQDFNSYAEFSQSGDGIHVFCKGTLPKAGRKKGNHEMYCDNRFFAVTGDHIDKTPKTVNEAQECIEDYYKLWFEEYEIPENGMNLKSPSMTDEKIIQLIDSAQNGEKIRKLHSGDISNYPSTSEADFAYCRLLAFYTQDKKQIDKIYRTSKLYTKKWDRRGKYTLDKVVIGLTEVYLKTESEDEISLAELKKLKMDQNSRKMPNLMDILPANHFINTVTDWMSGLSDTYYEYQVSTVLWLLSDLIQVKGTLVIKQGTIRPNLYVLLLGLSTKSRKSTAVNKIEQIREAATSTELYNDEPTIEGYLEMLALNPVQSFVCDEVSGLLAKYHKKYK
jgi:primase-polymerase (primpol)-like protein